MLVMLSGVALAGTLSVPSDFATIGEAVSAASDGDTISISPGVYAETVLLDRDLTLEGSPGTEIRGAADEDVVLTVGAGRDVTLRRVSVAGERQRRCISVDADTALVVEDSAFYDCVTTRSGGAIASVDAARSVVVRNSTFRDNEASSGAHISVQNSDRVDIDGCTFTGGHATGNGGGVRILFTDDVDLRRSTFEDNHADGSVGALILNEIGQAEVSQTLFCNNSAVSDAGALAVYGDQGFVWLRGSLLIGNTAGGNGGALFASGLGTIVTNAHFVRNQSARGHAAFVAAGDHGTIVNALVAHNSSMNGGGAALDWADASKGVGAYVLFHDNGKEDSNRPVEPSVLADPLLPTGFPKTTCNPMAFVPEGPDNPTLDAGSPTIVDADDSPSDIGAFGGPLPFDAEDADGDGVVALQDCDDEDASVFPGAPEACNGTDDDCDGSVPEDELDGDGDGASICGGDCDDFDPDVGPDRSETTCDGVDNDCDATTPDAPDEACDEARPGGDEDEASSKGCATGPQSWGALGILLLLGVARRSRG